MPEASRIELPILLELAALGGIEQLQGLHGRLLRYFPQLLADDGTGAAQSAAAQAGLEWKARWLRLLRRVGQQLEQRGELRRQRSRWELTDKGRRRVAQEALHLQPPTSVPPQPVGHQDLQRMLVELGHLLGNHAEAEFEGYDVVWRECKGAPRLSHVFEVQVAGSVDSALTRLKRAHEAQRSRLFLVIADERSGEFAARRMSGAFHELADILVVIGSGELARMYQALHGIHPLLEKLSARD